MTDKEIEEDRKQRAKKLEREMNELLKKHQFHLSAEDTIGRSTAIKVAIQFIDDKEYPQAELAQPHQPNISQKEILDVMEGKGDKI